MSETVLRPNPSSFPRPQSLHLPESTDTESIISASSYSPFPVFPGARDPHGLDQYLLHPGDPSWEYSDPIPASEAPTEEDAPRLAKRHSFIMLRRPSPLSQPPVSADKPAPLDVPIQRRRSNTTGSPIERSPKLTLESLPPVRPVFTDFEPMPVSMTGSGSSSSSSSNKGSLRRALTFTRRSFLGKESLMPEISPSPSTPRLSARSDSNYSEISSASSTSSGEEIKTPSEAVLVSSQVELAGGKLAEALAAESESMGRRKTWRGWLSGKRLSKLPSAMSSKTSLVSTDSSPASSTSSLPRSTSPAITSIVASEPISRSDSEKSFQDVLASEQLRRLSISKLAQIRSPSPHPLALSLKRQYCNLPDEIACSIQSGQKVFPLSVNVVDPSSPLSPGQGGLTTSLAIKSILQKLEQGHTPPPLPRRTPSKRSILPRPKGVLDFISRPPFEERNIVLYPNGTFSPISMARPGYGVWDLDFTAYILALSQVDELPDEGWPIIPRASIGASIDELEAVMSRVGESDDMEGIKPRETGPLLPGITFTLSTSSSSSSISADEATPTLASGPTLAATSSSASSTSDVAALADTAPESSFRRGRVLTWDESSESSDDEAEAESEDEQPLRAIQHRRSFPAQLSTSSTRSSLAVPDQPRLRASSQPGKEADRTAFRRSVQSTTVRRYSPNSRSAQPSPRTRTLSLDVVPNAMDAVAQARERRQANIAGEGERRAEAEQRRHETKSKTKSHSTSAGPPVGSATSYSSPSGSKQHARLPSVTIHPASPLPTGLPNRNQAHGLSPRQSHAQLRHTEGRPTAARSPSYYDSLPRRPNASRQHSTPGSPAPSSSGSGSGSGSMNGKRYNSFYGALPTHPTHHSPHLGYANSPHGQRYHASLPPLGQYPQPQPQPWGMTMHMQMPLALGSNHVAQMGHMGQMSSMGSMYDFGSMGYQSRGLGVPQGYGSMGSRRRHVN